MTASGADPGALRVAAGRLGGVAAALDGQARELRSSAAALGLVWTGDAARAAAAELRALADRLRREQDRFGAAAGALRAYARAVEEFDHARPPAGPGPHPLYMAPIGVGSLDLRRAAAQVQAALEALAPTVWGGDPPRPVISRVGS